MDLKKTQTWLSEFGKLIEGFSTDVTAIICPPAPYLEKVAEFAKGYDWISVGSQDISAYDEGAHTGEEGAAQVKDYAEYCIVGHSERKEERSVVNQKVDLALSTGLTPIVGFVDSDQIADIEREKCLLLWEDPENISKGGVFKPKPVSDIEEGCKKIREKYDIEHGLLYGGSINRQNASDLGNMFGLDGGVVGGASLDPQHFFEIVKAFSV